MRLRAAIFVEIAVDPVAERDDAEELLGLGRPFGSSASTVRRSSVRSAPIPVSLSIALTGRSRKRLDAPAASAISLRPIAVS